MNTLYHYKRSFELESGIIIPELVISYSTYGRYISGKSKVIWVCHALTANSEVFNWWPGLFGDQELFNPQDYFIICANIIGSCYGTTGPLSHLDTFPEFSFHRFPEITIRDMVKAHILLADHLSIRKIDFLIGGSLGGQQALEWAIIEPERIRKLGLIATNARFSPWGIAFNESQRMAIRSDQTWIESTPNAGLEGLKTARSIALLTYRNYRTYQDKQLEEDYSITSDFKAATYQRYQGLKLALRFNAFSYSVLSKAMDSHNIARGRLSLEKTLSGVTAATLVIGLSSDILFPVSEQEFLANHIFGASLAILDSLYGHDGFLIETPTLTTIIREHLK